MKTLIQAVHVPVYISKVISAAAAAEGPGWMTCFPAGLLYLLICRHKCKNISEFGGSCKFFQERMAKLVPLDLSGDLSPLMGTFPKRDNLWIV